MSVVNEEMNYAIKLPEYLYGMYNQKFKTGYTEEELGVNREEVLKEFPNLIGYIDTESLFNVNHVNVGYRMEKVPMLVTQFEKRKASNENEFLRIEVSNAVCSVSGNVFDDGNGKVKSLEDLLKQHRVVNVTAVVDEYPKGSGRKNLKIFDIEKNEDLRPEQLLKTTKQNVDDLIIELIYYVNRIEEPFHSITKNALKKNWELFSTRPAAKGNHHAYIGGLLKHTVGLLRVADFLLKKEDTPLKSMMHITQALTNAHQRALWSKDVNEMDNYTRFTLDDTMDHVFYLLKKYKILLSELPKGTTEQDVLNESIIFSSIIFHDMGKIHEYSNPGDKRLEKFQWLFNIADFSNFNDESSSSIDMDEVGGKGGHMLFGILAFLKSAEEVGVKVDFEDLMEIIHIILSHHGKLEWGSNVFMQTLNAVIVHFSDYIDSRFEKDDVTEE